MKAQDLQLKVMLEQGLTPLECAESLGLEPEVVHHRILLNPVLQNCASVTGVAETDEQVVARLMRGSLSMATQTLRQVMQCSENDGVRLKAAMYVLDKLAPQTASKGEVHNTQLNVSIDARRAERAERREKLVGKAAAGPDKPKDRVAVEVPLRQLMGLAV